MKWIVNVFISEYFTCDKIFSYLRFLKFIHILKSIQNLFRSRLSSFTDLSTIDYWLVWWSFKKLRIQWNVLRTKLVGCHVYNKQSVLTSLLVIRLSRHVLLHNDLDLWSLTLEVLVSQIEGKSCEESCHDVNDGHHRTEYSGRPCWWPGHSVNSW